MEKLTKSIFIISKMDCPSEENQIRMKLEGLDGIRQLQFDIGQRSLSVFHFGPNTNITHRLENINLGARLIKTETVDDFDTPPIDLDDSQNQARLLWIVLLINISFFFIEVFSGFIFESMGLMADSLDMLADAIVYGLSLWAVGAGLARQKKVATLSGYFQIALAGFGLLETIRRFFAIEKMPDYRIMIGVSFLALLANIFCLYLLQKTRTNEAHIKASMIFTSNDVIINFGVIVAGVMVLLTQSQYPDLVIGSIVFMIVVRGAIRILNLGK